MLSGTSQLCSLLENSAKYRQICKADLRRSLASLRVICAGGSIGQALSQTTNSLLQAHSTRIGAAASNDLGRVSQIVEPRPIARKGIQSIYRSTAVWRSPNSASAAVSHSSKRSRVTRCRTSVRTTASSDNSVWCATNVNESKTVKLLAKRLLRATRAIRALRAMIARVSPKAISNHAGTNKMQIVARVHRTGWPITSQPNKSNAKIAGSMRLRRRLSKIFQRETTEIGFGTRAPD